MKVVLLKVAVALAAATLLPACGLHSAAKGPQPSVTHERALSSPTPDAAKADWYEYEPAVVELEGTLVVKTFFGPPNYGEDPETDEKQETRILSLDKPINMRSKDENDPVLGPTESDVRELQLVFDGKLRKRAGKKVVVKGTLFHAHTGHHHTDVLLAVESISLAQ